MSAFAALYHAAGVDADTMRRMAAPMSHCGPDGENAWAEGLVGLAHRMLWTTPESLQEELPLVGSSGCVITADARIDNRADLIAALGFDDTVPDSTLILGAYERWGEACLDRLIGDFAFVIWDPERKALFGARDHFGVKPFYYADRPGELFACATEIKALLTLPEIPAELNEERLADFLATMREDRENTIYAGILRLPSAHAVNVDASGVRIWRYYTLAPATDVPQDATDEEYEARFRALFTEAVRARLRSAFPVGTELSGGMDSSSITCVAREVLPAGAPLHTVSLVYDDLAECDERPFINEVLSRGEFIAHFVRGDRLGPLENIDEVYTYLDDGLASGNQHLVWSVKKKASEAGIRVLLDGIDGDNVVGHGLLYLKELAEAGEWETFAYESEAVARVFSTTDQRHNFEDSFADPTTAFRRFGRDRLQQLAEDGPWWRTLREVSEAARHMGLGRRDLLSRYWKRMVEPKAVRKWRMGDRLVEEQEPTPIMPLLDSAFAERIGMGERLRRFRDAAPELTAQRDMQRQLLAGSRIQTALELTSHVGAAHGLEMRHPFFDKRLVEFCLALPASQSLKDGWTRSILRRALDVLPDAIRWRVGKAWMASNFERGLYEQDADLLREHVTDLGPLAPFVDQDVVRDLYERGRHVHNIQQAQLARIATLSLWLKKRFAAVGGSAPA